jgi:hypothetical protein
VQEEVFINKACDACGTYQDKLIAYHFVMREKLLLNRYTGTKTQLPALNVHSWLCKTCLPKYKGRI